MGKLESRIIIIIIIIISLLGTSFSSRLKYSFAAALTVSQRGIIKSSGENEVMLS